MITVTCAIIRNDRNEVLIVQRGEDSDHPYKWEFPGGKIKSNETAEECIVREITEELSISIVICKRLDQVNYDYGHKQISLIPFICDTIDDLPFLAEHIAFRWVNPDDLKQVDFSGADIIVAENYLDFISRSNHGDQDNQPPVAPEIVDEDLKSMIDRMVSMKEAEWVATSALDNPAIFNKLFEFSFSPDRKLAFRSSWILSKVCDRDHEIIYPGIPAIIDALDNIDNESVQRSFLRILSFSDIKRIPGEHHGKLAEHCFTALRSAESAIAIKAYSMEILYKLALVYPELANELAASVNMLQGESSAGVVARGRLILKKLAEISGEH